MPVNEPSSHASLEEAAAAVACIDPVMFSAACVSTDSAEQSRAQGFSRSRTLG